MQAVARLKLICALASLSLAYVLKSDVVFCTFSRKYGRKAFGNTVRLLYSVLSVATLATG
ncbi:hypothetical protein EcCFBP13530_16415 [Enterobacter cancerogenus]|uniref:Uncharacterized protein n=1 Tax=Enterobacter cancerogenus TaxID=69218 RepID=A0AB38P1R9_9ENTR|nr:hypothetical protein EcCFBP13530_16415 [Enterobacter cancerogenus]